MRRQQLSFTIYNTIHVFVLTVLATAALLPPPAVLAVAVGEVFDRQSWDRTYAEQNGVEYYKTCDASGSTTQSSGGNKPGTVTTGDGGGCGSTDAEANKRQIWNYLKSKGLTDAAAAGIMGNMEQESGFMPTADNSKTMGFTDSTGKGCRGIVQWCHERNSGLDSFAAERGKSWDCLGVQLEYLWHEMTETEQGQFDSEGNRLEIPLVDALNGGNFSAKGNYTGSDPANAAAIFHDYFERANKSSGEHLGRGERAEGIYEEFTGKAVEPTPDSTAVSQGSSGDQCASKTETAASEDGAPIPSAECDEVVKKIKDLTASGKIQQDSGRQDNDLKNCTTDQVACGTSGGSGIDQAGGGVHPNILRATAAIAENTGDGQLVLWSFNSGHSCDGLNHPNGKAVDIPCGDSSQGGYTDMEKCKRIVDYLIAHKEELGITELLWQTGYRCDSGVDCTIDGHGDHIHIGVRG